MALTGYAACLSGRLFVGTTSLARPGKVQNHAFLRPQPPRQARKLLLARASGDSEAFSPNMTNDQAYKLLGVKEGATFDEIMTAKNRIAAANANNQEKIMEVEAAYEHLLMESMKRRLSGELQVSTTVRFADVPKKRPAPQPPKGLQANIPNLVSIGRVDNNLVVKQSVVFGTLAAWTLLQGLTAQPGMGDDVPGLQLALATAASVYFFRDSKRLGFGRAAGLTVAGLVAGAVFGGVLQGWLRVDIVPIGGLSSPSTLVSEFALLGLWAACAFLV